ncbi:MAG TPA: response regulator transcription factor [Phaeodactylibacter sp.]|nr:response regulator transcription factor [Phaeodactylibacter sp.]
MTSIRTLIVEDEPLIAEDIRDCISNFDYEPVAVAYTKDEAFQCLEKYDLDIVLLDINLGGKTDGIEIAKVINKKYKIPFIFLTSYSDKATLEMAKVTHPWGYLVKPFQEHDLFTSLEIAMFNFSKSVQPRNWEIENINKKIKARLTQKEFEILTALYEGKTNKQLAEEHFISVNTVKTHLKNIFEKLNVKTRTAAISSLYELNQ